jgi:hypothetical protein
VSFHAKYLAVYISSVTCPDNLDMVENGVIRYSTERLIVDNETSYTVGTKATVFCPGFEVIVICEETGSWNTIELTCESKYIHT